MDFGLNLEFTIFISNNINCQTWVTEELEKTFIEDIEKCEKLDLEKFENVGFFKRIKWSFFRLLSPLL